MSALCWSNMSLNTRIWIRIRPKFLLSCSCRQFSNENLLNSVWRLIQSYKYQCLVSVPQKSISEPETASRPIFVRERFKSWVQLAITNFYSWIVLEKSQNKSVSQHFRSIRSSLTLSCTKLDLPSCRTFWSELVSFEKHDSGPDVLQTHFNKKPNIPLHSTCCRLSGQSLELKPEEF